MNNITAKKPAWLYIIIFVIVVLIASLSIVSWTMAFFFDINKKDTGAILDVNGLFGMLDSQIDSDVEWGSEENPYLIYENRHLSNLYLLQNNKDIALINENTVFQVSDTSGNPCFVGGDSVENLFEIDSIGSEDFPFISILKGVTTTVETDFAELPDGKVSDTSVIGNIKVLAYDGQIDIGLFGNVGRADENDIDGTAESVVTTGYIGNLLISNVQISASYKGDTSKVEHTDYTVNSNHETNHIGILIGHAQYCTIEKISVYYSTVEENGTTKAQLDAFEVLANDSQTKYTTAGGIIGFYKQIMTEDASYPVNSDGINKVGGTQTGMGTGIVYSQDIWAYMENLYGEPMTGNSYNLQDEPNLNDVYAETVTLAGMTKTYFKMGVFTFVHSRQSLNKDRIVNLWQETDSNMWDISTTGQYTTANQTLDIASSKYECTQITTNNITSVTGYRYPNESTFGTNYNNYRYMFVAESNGVEYALVKNGETVVAQRIDTGNFIIPSDLLKYYTFRVANSRTNSGTTPDGLNRYTYGNSSRLRLNAVGAVTYNMQYLCYGQEVKDTSGNIVEEERPLRIYDTISYMYSSSAVNYPEGIRLYYQNTGTSTAFRLHRSYSASRTLSNYLYFSQGAGYKTVTAAGSATYIKLYAVKVAPTVSNADYNKQINTPTSATTLSVDMSKNVLFYDGSYNSENFNTKYRYQLKSLESLNWPNSEDLPIETISTALKMADPSSYYYISSTPYGLLQNIPMSDGKVMYAPRGSIAYTVNGTGTPNDKSKINVIVAYDPSQLVDQTIEVSYMNTNANTGRPSGDRTPVDSATIVLPPVPGSGGKSATIPIRVSINNGTSYFNAYPNMNTLLIAYTLEVDCQNTRTYFLESTKGSATFIYCSVEKTASRLSNPEHKNNVFYDNLNGIDYVYDITSKNAKNEDVTRIITVKKNDGLYVDTLIQPYFGVLSTKITNPIQEIISVLNAKNFYYSIARTFEYEEDYNSLFINVVVPNTSLSAKELWLLMNFNFYDGTYYDTAQAKRFYSDIVFLTINGTIIDWKEIYKP